MARRGFVERFSRRRPRSCRRREGREGPFAAHCCPKNALHERFQACGPAVAAIADTPKVMSDGNWRLGVVIDEAASEEQADKLGAVFSGALGGPMSALEPLVGENLGVERLPIEVKEDGLKHSVRIGEAIDFEVED